MVTIASVAALREAIDEAVADLAAGPGDEDDWFAHQRLTRYRRGAAARLTIDGHDRRARSRARQTAAPMKWSIRSRFSGSSHMPAR